MKNGHVSDLLAFFNCARLFLCEINFFNVAFMLLNSMVRFTILFYKQCIKFILSFTLNSFSLSHCTTSIKIKNYECLYLIMYFSLVCRYDQL